MFSPNRNKEEKKKLSKESFKRALGIFKYLKKHWFLFSFGMLLIVLSGLLLLVITALLGQLVSPGEGGMAGGSFTSGFVDKLQFAQNFGTIGKVLTALIGLLILQGIISFFRVYIFSYVTENAMLTLRKDLFSTIIRMPMQFFHERQVGDLNSRISSDISTVQETLTVTLAEVIRQTVIVIIGVAWLVSYSYKLTLVMLCTLPVIIIVMVIFGRYIRRLGKETQNKVAASNVIVNESFTGIVNVKSFTNESFETSRFTKSISGIKAIAMRGAVWRGMFSTFIIVFLFSALGIIIGMGSYLRSTGEIPDVLNEFLFIAAMVAGSIGGLAAQMGTIQRNIGVIDTVMEILELKPEEVSLTTHTPTSGLKGDIRFDNVSFHYASRPDTPVLSHISFNIEHGQQVALVGSSGAGKSTIASLVQRFYEPTEGSLFFDGKVASSYSLTALRNEIAYVPQEVILFGGTIRENIEYGKPGSSFEEIKDAARKANALSFIEAFPDNFETIVGDRGIQLSGGQRQRIAIARAVLRNPTILILDEATSSLDSESERQVQDALEKLMHGRTSLVIAHRLSTIRNSSKIIVLDKGTIREEGTHDSLIASNGMYKRLNDLQFDSERISEQESQ